jgi:hypothetical protein
MTASKDDVLAALGKISAPGGVPLPATGKLSEIVCVPAHARDHVA